MNVQSLHKWSLKPVVFGSGSSLPPFVVVVALPRPVWPAGPLPIKGNKLLRSLGYRSNPQRALLQAEWLGAEVEVGAILTMSI